MRFIYIISLICILFSPLAQAGHVIYKNMYVAQDLVQGFGNSMQNAMSDASSAKPFGYVLDPSYSWVVWEMHQGDWMATRPIIRSYPDMAKQPIKVS